MDDGKASRFGPGASATDVRRTSDRELVVTRSFNAPVPVVFEAWSRPELLQRWWAPKSFGVVFLSCEADVRAGGAYRFVMGLHASERTIELFGRYLEVTPPERLVWTNEEGGADGSVTTVTFEDDVGRTRVVMRDFYPTKEALDTAVASNATKGFGETFDQLDAFLTH